MVRIVHLADVHLGVENYGRLDPATGLSTRLTDFLQGVDAAIDMALEIEADLVVFAGDAYKTRDPSPTYQREFARRIRRLSQAGLPTVLAAGNHDVPNAVGRAHTMEIFATLDVENVYVARSPEVIDVDLWTTHPEREENLVHLVTGHELRRDYFEDAKVDARTTCWAAGKSEPVSFYGFSRFAHIMPFNLDNTPLTGKSTDATPPGSAPGR